MGRKTNSVSLRLKKTNRDYNNCWYSDILYAENFSKSLKIENYLSQTLKTLSVPCPRTSVIGVFKKAGLLVCYLDPKKRKRLLEKCSKGFQSKRTLQAPKNQSSKKAFFSLGKVKQDSKALLNPLNALLKTNFGPKECTIVAPFFSLEHQYAATATITTPKDDGWHPVQYRADWPLLKADGSSLEPAGSVLNAGDASQKASPYFVTQEAEKKSLAFVALGRNQVEMEQQEFHVKKADSFSKKVKTNNLFLNYFYRGSISLDLVLNKEFATNDVSLTCSIKAKPSSSFYTICNFLCLERDVDTKKQMAMENKASKAKATRRPLFESLGLTENNPFNNNFFEAIYFSSVDHLKTQNSFFLKDNFFVKKKENSLSGNSNLLDFSALDSITNKNYKGKFFNLFEKDVFLKKNIKANTVIFLKGNKVNQASKEIALQKKPSQRSFTDLNFFPFFFENKKATEKAWFKFQSFSEFFHNEISNLALMSAFSKNNQFFGKNESYDVLSKKTFSPLSFLLNKPFLKNLVKNSDKVEIEVVPCMRRSKHESKRVNQGVITPISKQNSFFALSKKKENCSLTSLYVFYNGISSFWGNLVSLSFYKSTNEISCALFLAECVGYLLEKKVPFRSLKRQLLIELHQSKYSFSGENSLHSAPKNANLTSKVSHSSQASQALALPFLDNNRKITGIRITCSGRVGGRSKKAQRSRKDTFMWGETGLHVFSSKLDFAKTHAETPFGLVGVQVWVCTK